MYIYVIFKSFAPRGFEPCALCLLGFQKYANVPHVPNFKNMLMFRTKVIHVANLIVGMEDVLVKVNILINKHKYAIIIFILTLIS